MNRFLTFAALAACLVALGASAQQQQPTFRGTSDAVRVFVTVTDRENRIVTTLTQNDFEIRDEGKPQPITLFDNTPQPVRLVVLLDVSGSMEGNLPLLRAAAEQLFTRLAAEDRARVGTFGRDVVISAAFTRDPAELRRALPTVIVPDAPTPLWRAVDEAINTFADDGEGRSVILVLSDGKDTGPMSFREKPISQAEVIDRARAQDVMVFGIGMRSRGPRSPNPFGPGGIQAALIADLPDPGLALVAEQTGGGYIEIRPSQDLGEAFARVVDELHSQYLIGFAPPKKDGKVHDLEVRIPTQKGLKPRARKNYVAPKG
jgi:Ca-activated chloride channel family protein